MPHSPEQAAFAAKVKSHPGELHNMTPRMLKGYLEDAPEYQSCYYLFWTINGQKFLIVYRKDRQPVNEEIFPIMECLFDDGKVHEVGGTNFSREFTQNAYSEKMGVDVIADAMANVAERDGHSDAFDFERTETGKRMRRAAQEKNGVR